MRSVVVESGASGYVQTIAIGPHRLTADAPARSCPSHCACRVNGDFIRAPVATLPDAA